MFNSLKTLWEHVQKASAYIESKRVSEPFASARILMASALELPSVEIVLQRTRELDSGESGKFWELVERRAQGEPIAYILGSCEFFSIQLKIGCGALIPRPETEHVVEAALDVIDKSSEPSVLDLATGSGCIAVAIAKNSERAKIVASDISESALSWAAKNVGEQGLGERINLVCADMVSCFAQAFDMVVCNPPYVSEFEFSSVSREVRDFEPKEALVAGDEGLDFIARMFDDARAVVVSGGHLIFEIGAGQIEGVKKLARSCGWGIIDVRRDFSGIERVVIAKR